MRMTDLARPNPGTPGSRGRRPPARAVVVAVDAPRPSPARPPTRNHSRRLTAPPRQEKPSINRRHPCKFTISLPGSSRSTTDTVPTVSPIHANDVRRESVPIHDNPDRAGPEGEPEPDWGAAVMPQWAV